MIHCPYCASRAHQITTLRAALTSAEAERDDGQKVITAMQSDKRGLELVNDQLRATIEAQRLQIGALEIAARGEGEMRSNG